MSELVEKLSGMLLSPVGLIGVPLIILCLVLGSSSDLGRLRLLGLAMFLSSLGRFENEWEVGLPLIFGLEQLRAVGRYVAFGLVGMLCVQGFLKRQHIPHIPKTVFLWLLVQLVISAKYLMAGSQVDALLQVPLAVGSTLAVLYALSADPVRNTAMLRQLLLVAGGLFIAANTTQWLINPAALFISKGLFVGTTGNPQHAAVYLAIVTIGSAYFFISEPQGPTRGAFATLCAFSLLGLLLSGSRTGMGMVVVGGCVLMHLSGQRLRFTVGVASLALVAGLAVHYFSGQDATNDFEAWNKIHSQENTRAGVFRYQVATFREYPLAGKPFRLGMRCRFGESSWLGAAAHAGLLGLVPMILAVGTVGWQWLRIRQSRRAFRATWAMPFAIAGLLMLLAGSFLEAYLLGVVTFPVFWTIALLATIDSCYRQVQGHVSASKLNRVVPNDNVGSAFTQWECR